jgi:hypothetical protein
MRWFEKEFSNMRWFDIGQGSTKYERLMRYFPFG